MAKSNLIQVFNIIKNGESDYQKKIVTNFVSDLLQDALLNISSNHNRPDFDRVMYNYNEPSWKHIKTYQCDATTTMVLKFNAVQTWEFDYRTEEYSELIVKEIINPRIEWMGMVITLDEWLNPLGVRKAIMHSANGIAVEEWDFEGDPRP